MSKFFYEIVKDPEQPNKVVLMGPNQNIEYANPEYFKSNIKYVEFDNGVETRGFTDEQILVTDFPL